MFYFPAFPFLGHHLRHVSCQEASTYASFSTIYPIFSSSNATETSDAGDVIRRFQKHPSWRFLNRKADKILASSQQSSNMDIQSHLLQARILVSKNPLPNVVLNKYNAWRHLGSPMGAQFCRVRKTAKLWCHVPRPLTRHSICVICLLSSLCFGIGDILAGVY